MLKKNSLSISIFLLMISCSMLPISQQNPSCSFPSSEPYPGGLINYELYSKEELRESDFSAEGLKFFLCHTTKGVTNIIIPIPLSMQKNELNIYLKNKKIVSVDLEEKYYRESRIKLNNQDFVTPPPSMQQRIRREYIQGREAINTFNENRSMKMGMELPVEGIISSEFGVKRFINDQPRNRHIGLDIAADEGTPIFAPLEGEVILVDNFFYKGNVIFLDHGNGLVSSFSHLSSVAVKTGERIYSKQLLGTIGTSGRVTGPHLHWEVSFLGVPINPEIFLSK